MRHDWATSTDLFVRAYLPDGQPLSQATRVQVPGLNPRLEPARVQIVTSGKAWSQLRQKLWARLSRGRFGRSVLLLVGSSAFGHGLYLLVTPFLTRLYTPEAFGVFGLISSVLGVAGAMISLRFDMAIISADDQRDAGSLLALALGLTLVVSCGAVAATGLLIRFGWFGFGGLPRSALMVLLPLLCAEGVSTALRNCLIRSGDFKVIGALTVRQGVGRAGVSLGGGLLAAGWLGLTLGEVAGRALGIVKSWTHLGINPGRLMVGRAELCRVWKRYHAFAKYSMPSSVIDTLALSLPVPIVAMLFGQTQAGYLFLALRVVALPSALLARSYGDVFHNEIANAARTRPQELEGLVRRHARHLLALGLLPSLVFLALAPWLFTFAFGATWRTAGVFAATIAPWALAGFVITPLSRCVFVLNGMHLKLIYDVAALAGLLAVCFGLHRAGCGPQAVVAGITAVQVVAYAAYFLLLRLMARRYELLMRVNYDSSSWKDSP